MRRSLWFIPTLMALLIAACGDLTASAPTTIESLGFGGATQVTGAAFLPPVGRAVDTADFFPGAALEIRVVAVDGPNAGARLAPTLRTADGTIRLQDEAYMALWRVRDTVRAYGDVNLVRVEVWVEGPHAGLAVAAACGGADPCLAGSFEARIRASRAGRSDPGVLDLTRTQTLPIRFFLAAAPTDPALRPTSLSELRRLASPNDFFDDFGPNCAVNEFNMPGQGLNALGSGLNALGSGLNALGSVGGMFLFGPGETAGAPGIRILEAGEAGRLAADVVFNQFEGILVRNAAILVVDDFAGIYDLDPGLISPSDRPERGPSCGASSKSGGFSHGALVMRQTVQMIEAAGFEEDAFRPWSGSDFRVFHRSAGEEQSDVYLVVAAVDTNGLDTDVIPERIQNALNALRFYGFVDDGQEVTGLDVLHVAINMSFVIVPCSVLEDYDASALADFEAYREALGADNGVAEDFYAELTELLVTPLEADADPLLGQIVCQEEFDDEYGGEFYYDGQYPWSFYVETPDYDAPFWGCGDRSTVYVGSSGNFGLDYAMYPAAWPEVLSVGSQDGVGTEPDDGFSSAKSGFSNDAEVMAPGALYLLGQSSTGARALAYAGTSFSAPVASLFTALDLMQDSPRCTGAQVSYLTWEDDRANTPLPEAAINCGVIDPSVHALGPATPLPLVPRARTIRSGHARSIVPAPPHAAGL
jgi:hypothetical protein